MNIRETEQELRDRLRNIKLMIVFDLFALALNVYSALHISYLFIIPVIILSILVVVWIRLHKTYGNLLRACLEYQDMVARLHGWTEN